MHKLSNSKDLLALHLRLLWFTNLLKNHIVVTVLASTTAEMRIQLASASDIDAMAAVHGSYVKRLESQCFLTNKLDSIRKAIISILDLCVLLHQVLEERTGTRLAASGHSRQSHQTEPIEEELEDEQEQGDDAENDGETRLQDSSSASVSTMKQQYGQLFGFLASGLRAVSQAGGEQSWEMLADSLEAQANERHV